MPRFTKSLVSLACATTVVAAGPAFAQTAFEPVGGATAPDISFATAISPDGGTIVGYTGVPTFTEAFRWSLGGELVTVASLANSTDISLRAVSADGAVLVGQCFVPGLGVRAFRVTDGGGTVSLGERAGFLAMRPRGISADGATIVGYADTFSGFAAFKWTAGAGLQPLASFPAGTMSLAHAISGDGSTVVGYTIVAGNYRAFRWTQAGGVQDLGLPAGGGRTGAIAWGVSHDGGVIVGSCSTASGTIAFRWTAETGMVELGTLDGDASSIATAVSADGNTIVGTSTNAGVSRAFAWTAPGGMVDVAARLATTGALDAGWTLAEATAVSGDGSSIVGNGRNENKNRAWLAKSLFACNAADIAAEGAPFAGPDGFLTGVDFDVFVGSFFDATRRADGRYIADLTDGAGDGPADGFLTGSDFDFFLAAFFKGC